MGSEDEHTQVFKFLDLVLEVNDLKQQLAAKDKALRDIQSALNAFGKMGGSNTLFERVQDALDTAEKVGE